MQKLHFMSRGLALILFTVTLFTACSKHNSPKPDNKTLIVGIWKLSGLSSYFQANGSTDKALISQESRTDIFEFTADGNLLLNGSDNSDYTVEGNTLSTEGARGAAHQYTITKLGQHDMVFEGKQEDQVYNDTKGTVYIVYTLQK